MTAEVLEQRALPTLWLIGLQGDEYVDYINVAASLAVSTAGYQDCSDEGDITLAAAEGTAFCSSSDAGDTGTVKLTYMDDQYVVKTITETLAGQTKTQFGTVTNVFRFLKLEAVSAAPDGDVYAYEDDTVTAGVPDTAGKKKLQMRIGFNVSLSSVQATPAGKVGLLPLGNRLGAGSVAGMSGRFMVANVNGVFNTIMAPSGLASADTGFIVPVRIEEKTDFKWQCKHDGGGAVQMSGTVPIILVADQ